MAARSVQFTKKGGGGLTTPTETSFEENSTVWGFFFSIEQKCPGGGDKTLRFGEVFEEPVSGETLLTQWGEIWRIRERKNPLTGKGFERPGKGELTAGGEGGGALLTGEVFEEPVLFEGVDGGGRLEVFRLRASRRDEVNPDEAHHTPAIQPRH